VATKHRKGVFFNHPFDDPYTPLARAIVFAIMDCGYTARSALEVSDSADLRLQKIYRIIGECRLGIHDISRTELDAKTGLPRFNMPLELGVFLGARQYGSAEQQKKACLVLDRGRSRYVKFISDIRGLDPQAHDDDPNKAIAVVRDWLDDRSTGDTIQPDGEVIAKRYAVFVSELPAICAAVHLNPSRLTFKNYVTVVRGWLKRNGR
jgi:hypothetical protein